MKGRGKYFKLRRFINWAIAIQGGLLWVCSYLQSWVLTFLYASTLSEQKWKRNEILAQVYFQRRFRNPQAINVFFKKTLRVCVTYRCNLKCNYCYARGIETQIPEDMKLKDFFNLVIWAKEKKWKGIRFLGGEPTIHPEFIQMLDICYQHQMNVTMSSNNLFSHEIVSKFEKPWISYVSLNYSPDVLNDKQKSLFKENLKRLKEKKIPFELSCVLGYRNEGISEILEDARVFRPICIRASIAIPGLAKQISVEDLTADFKTISAKLFRLQDNCIKSNLPFYIYRPIMPCLFSREEWKKLKGIFRFTCFTRCPLGIMGDYSATVVVNPDLSTFPCAVTFVKGPSILTFKNKKEISDFYQREIKNRLSDPLMEACNNCQRRESFLDDLIKGEKSDLKNSYKESLCQGGCLSFKQASCGPC